MTIAFRGRCCISKVICVVIGLMPLATARPLADSCLERGLVTSLGQKLTRQHQPTQDDSTVRIHQAQASYIRVRLKLEDRGTCNWRLVLRDRQFRAIQILDATGFASGMTIWSTRIYGDTLYLDLIDCLQGTWPKVISDQQVWMPEFTSNPFYSAKNSSAPDWVSLEESELQSEKRLGDYVGFLVGMGSVETRNWACSGVMVAPNLFLTNWHCIAPLPNQDPASMQNLLVDLSWDKDSLSGDYQVLSLAAGSPQLDFALLEVKPLGALGPTRFAILRESPPRMEPVRLIHHPEGRRKQLSAACHIRETNFPMPDSPFLSHDCDSEAGSSGAPLFDATGRVVGLHHCGFSQGATVKRNRAVRIDKILKHLTETNPAVFARLAHQP